MFRARESLRTMILRLVYYYWTIFIPSWSRGYPRLKLALQNPAVKGYKHLSVGLWPGLSMRAELASQNERLMRWSGWTGVE